LHKQYLATEVSVVAKKKLHAGPKISTNLNLARLTTLA